MTYKKAVDQNNTLNQKSKTETYHRFISKQMCKLLGKESITDLKLGDQTELKLSILFSDIRDFTQLSETLKPKENFDFINAYFSHMDTLIAQHEGIIDKYLGDGIMALFPTNADDALACAILMIQQMESFNKTQGAPIKIGIGLNTGLCMLGIVGGVNKIEATVISDAVNLSSRLESLTKTYGVDLLISEDTLYSLKDPSKYAIRFIDRVTVKGKSQPHSIYEVYDSNSSMQMALKTKTKNLFEEALANYHYKNIDEAKKLLSQCLVINPEDSAAKLYLNRCYKFAQNGFHEGAKELNLQIKWDNNFAVGNSEIDEQHIALFSHSQELLNAINKGAGHTEINSIIDFLDSYIIQHFETEETFLAKHKYPFINHQKEQHQNFIKSFELLKQEIKSGLKNKIFLMFRIQTLLIDWVVNHTIKEDKHYAKYITKN